MFTAQKNIVDLLTAAGAMEGEPRPITHPVKFWENGKKPLEIVTSNQWFIRYPPAVEIIERAKGLAIVFASHEPFLVGQVATREVRVGDDRPDAAAPGDGGDA